MQAVTPLPWMACAPSSMTGISRPCQDTEVVFGLLRLATTRQTDPGDLGKRNSFEGFLCRAADTLRT